MKLPAGQRETEATVAGPLCAQVFFYIDPEFLTDRKMGRLDSMTLSYTFFKSNEIYG